MSSERPPGVPGRDDDPTRPPPRPVAPPGQVSTPDQLPTVEPGEWPAQPPRAQAAQPPPPPPTPAAATPATPPSAPTTPTTPPATTGPPAPPYVPGPAVRRSLAWLWVTLAAVAVLVVGSAATLAVVQPWDDGDDDRGTTAEPGDPAPTHQPDQSDQSDQSDQTEQTDEPGDPGGTPSQPDLSATPTPPGSSEPVTADLDGDGLGDAAAVIGADDAIERVVLRSTGTSFEVRREPASSFDDRTWADFDGDGMLDEVSWSYQLGGGLTITSEDMDFRELNLSLRLDERQPFVSLKPGDFDGDGAVDLVAYGTEFRGTVSVWVIRNEDGRFSAPEEWMRVPNTSYASTTVLPADFTGDGRTDLAVRVPMEAPREQQRPDRLGFSFLMSTGAAFVPGPLGRPSGLADHAEVVVGDFTGDGTAQVLLIGDADGVVPVADLRLDGDRLVVDRRRTAELGGRGRIVDAVVSDVDGDLDDDVVYTTYVGRGRQYGGFRVLSLGGPAGGGAKVWAPTPRCPARSCSFYFQNSY